MVLQSLSGSASPHGTPLQRLQVQQERNYFVPTGTSQTSAYTDITRADNAFYLLYRTTGRQPHGALRACRGKGGNCGLSQLLRCPSAMSLRPQARSSPTCAWLPPSLPHDVRLLATRRADAHCVPCCCSLVCRH